MNELPVQITENNELQKRFESNDLGEAELDQILEESVSSVLRVHRSNILKEMVNNFLTRR